MNPEDAEIRASPGRQAKTRVSRAWLLRILGSAALLAATLAILPLDQFKEAMTRLSLGLLGMVLVAFLALHVVAALKWWMLCGRRVSAITAVRAHLAGLAGNLCLPGVIGGDLVRCGIVARAHGDPAYLVSASLVDRIIDMVALLFIASGGFLALLLFGHDGTDAPDVADNTGAFFLGGVAAVAVLVAALSSLPWIMERATGLPLPARVRSGLTKVAGAFRGVASAPWKLAFALTLSLAVQAGLASLALRLAGAMGVEIGPAAWFFAWPLAKILSVLPVSLGGLGVREAALSLLLLPYVADLAGVVAASLAWQVVLFLSGLIGGATWLLSELAIGHRFRADTANGQGRHRT